MKNIFVFFTRNQSLIYKVFLYVVATVLVIYLLPKGGQFKYNFQKGKPWQYENLYAPFNFTIKKDKESLEKERENVRATATPYFDVEPDIAYDAFESFSNLVQKNYVDSLYTTSRSITKEIGLNIVNAAYQKGVLKGTHPFNSEQLIYLKNGNEVNEAVFSQLFKKEQLSKTIVARTESYPDIRPLLNQLLSTVIVPNVTYNSRLTEASIKEAMEEINPNKGIIEKGSRIIAKGEVVEGNKFQILNSLKEEFQSQVWSQNNYYW